jgi:hypothetical protein
MAVARLKLTLVAGGTYSGTGICKRTADLDCLKAIPANIIVAIFSALLKETDSAFDTVRRGLVEVISGTEWTIARIGTIWALLTFVCVLLEIPVRTHLTV